MSPDTPRAVLEEAVLDLEAARLGLARFADAIRDAESAVASARFPVRIRGPLPRSPLPPQCPPDVESRYQVLLHLERTFPAEYDQSCVIFVGCQLLEAEIDRLVSRPLRPLAGALVDLLRGGRHLDAAAVVQAWAEGRMDATFFTHNSVVLGLHNACAGDHPTLVAFLRERFAPGYLDILRRPGLDATLAEIRRRFRNPVCHARSFFSRADYEDFARLVIAHRNFQDWEREGPQPASPGPDSGVLHHHWSQVRRAE